MDAVHFRFGEWRWRFLAELPSADGTIASCAPNFPVLAQKSENFRVF